MFAAIRRIYSVNVLSQAAALACGACPRCVRARGGTGCIRSASANCVPVRNGCRGSARGGVAERGELCARAHAACHARERLRDEYSILVRDFSYAPGLADCLRITVGTPQENDEVLAAFAALVKEEM